MLSRERKRKTRERVMMGVELEYLKLQGTFTEMADIHKPTSGFSKRRGREGARPFRPTALLSAHSAEAGCGRRNPPIHDGRVAILQHYAIQRVLVPGPDWLRPKPDKYSARKKSEPAVI
ncbi:hypothetical protein MRX96_043842 [Rhipicephalus microplus]